MVTMQYAYIVKDKRYCDGMAVIEGASMPVASIIIMQQQGTSLEGIVNAYPKNYLSLSKVHAALTYYYDHKEEIERDIARLQNPPAGFSVGKDGILRRE
jgi:uncharacterized protein (DUF433 family)